MGFDSRWLLLIPIALQLVIVCLSPRSLSLMYMIPGRLQLGRLIIILVHHKATTFQRAIVVHSMHRDHEVYVLVVTIVLSTIALTTFDQAQ